MCNLKSHSTLHQTLQRGLAVCRELLAQTTVAFQVCSETVNAAETGLREMQCLDMADILRVLQLNEKEKLRLTLILQALKQSYNKGIFSWQETHAGDHAQDHTVRAAPEPACQCCTAAEPTREEFAAAKAEALQGLQIVIENINDALEELKYAEAEYSEQDNV